MAPPLNADFTVHLVVLNDAEGLALPGRLILRLPKHWALRT